MFIIKFLKKVCFNIKFLFLMITNKKSNWINDYDRVSINYDKLFPTRMRKHTLKLIDELEITEGQRVLELGCGTGFVTFEIAERIGEYGKVLGVDLSQGMLGVAQKKLKESSFENVEFLHGDMLNSLYKFEDESYDIVVCAWAIVYSIPLKLLKQIYRVLKPGGKVGIIENRADSLEKLMTAFIKLAEENLKYVERTVDINLLKDVYHLESLFKKARLLPVKCWDGEEQVLCKNSDEAFNWLSESGGASGFMDVFNKGREEALINRFKEILDDDFNAKNGITLSYKFVAGIAKKPIKPEIKRSQLFKRMFQTQK